MRYKLTMMLALAAMVVSCSKGGGSDSAKPTQPTLPPYSYELSDSPIGFDGYEESSDTNPNTRAKVRSGAFSNGDAFSIHAYLDPSVAVAEDKVGNPAKTTYMDDVRVLLYDPNDTPEGKTNWVYAPTKYWPADTRLKIKFFAYYPHSQVGESTIKVDDYDPEVKSSPRVRYTPNANAAFHYDFMTASTGELYKNHPSLMTDGVYTGVPLSFEHQLAKVKFSANHNSTQIHDRVVITKVVYKGTKVCEAGTFDENDVFEWGALGTESKTYTLNTGLRPYEAGTETGDAYLPLYDSDNPTYKDISDEAGEGVLLLHPQEIGAGQVSFTVTFKVFRDGIESVTAEQEVAVPQAHPLTKGKAVNYQFTVNVNEVSSIVTSSIKYEEWVDSNEDNVSGTIK